VLVRGWISKRIIFYIITVGPLKILITMIELLKSSPA